MGLSALSLDCKTCNKDQKVERGCIEDSPIPDKWDINGVKFQRCPLSTLDRDVNWFMRAYNFVDKSILPNAGGWNDQTNKFIEAIDFINTQGQKDGKQRTRN